MFRVTFVLSCCVAVIEANLEFPSNAQVLTVCQYPNRTDGLYSMRMNLAIQIHVEICPCTVAPNQLRTVSKAIVCRFVSQNRVMPQCPIDTTRNTKPNIIMM